MGEGGTKLTVANRCQGNWKKTDVFVELDRLMKNDRLVFSMMIRLSDFQKNSSAPRLSAVLVNLGLDGGDVLDRENWVKRCQNILQPE